MGNDIEANYITHKCCFAVDVEICISVDKYFHNYFTYVLSS